MWRWREQVSLGFRPTWRRFGHILSSSCCHDASGTVSPSPRLHSACPFSTHEFLMGNPGAKLNSSHLQELTSFLLSSEGCWASNSPDLLFCLLETAALSTTKLWGTNISPEHHRLSLLPSQLSVWWTAATHLLPSLQGAFRLQSTSSGFSVMFWFVLFSTIFSVAL